MGIKFKYILCAYSCLYIEHDWSGYTYKMEEYVAKKVLDVVITSTWGAIAFLGAWIIRLTMVSNKTSVSVATILEAIKNLSKEVSEVKKDMTVIRNDMDTVLKCTEDQKGMWNATENERKRLAKELTENKIKLIRLQ